MMKFRLYILPIVDKLLLTPTDVEFKSESSVNDFIASGGPDKFKDDFSGDAFGDNDREEIELTILRIL